MKQTAQSKSGLLVHNISDHKIICTFIKIENNDKVSMKSFADELKNLNIYDKIY